MPVERPTAAFVLSLIGGIFILIGSLIVSTLAGVVGGAMMLIPFLGGFGALLIFLGILGVILGIIIIIGAIMINSGDPSRVRIGSILVLIFSILSLFTTNGGFIVGFILALIGSILGLVWKPSERRAGAPPPPPP
jgi:hypothetical protein